MKNILTTKIIIEKSIISLILKSVKILFTNNTNNPNKSIVEKMEIRKI
jgi:hypothetical protein